LTSRERERVYSVIAMAPRLVLAATGLLLAAFLACGESEEAVPNSETATAEPTVSVPPTFSVETGTPTPDANSTPVSAPPVNWVTLTESTGLFRIRYPPEWVLDESGYAIYSSDPTTFKGGPDLPFGVVKIEFGYYAYDGVSGCGQLQPDPFTGELKLAPGATAAELGGVEGWGIVREEGDPAIDGVLTRIQGVSTIYKGYCFHLAGYFTQERPDVETFEQVLSSYEFLF
jgi:hypothetical protein